MKFMCVGLKDFKLDQNFDHYLVYQNNLSV